ncbi:MAG: Lrp/AsnC family transcriptional regulator [Aquifex sp.]|nr:MAG: Lrp/AsnC family transcriptional regulator [Aquifex sp.]
MELLKMLQQDIPLTERPFEFIAKELGVTEKEVLNQIKKLKEEKLIRQISPIYDTRKAGYDSALVAFKVSKENVGKAVEIINSYPGVSHNYEREDEFNVWFTIAVPPNGSLSLEEVVHLMAKKAGVEDYAILRTKRTFKIGVKLTFNSLFEREEKVPEVKEDMPVNLQEEEKVVIRETQKDIPLVERPFKEIAQKIGLEEGEVIEILKKLKEKKVMRRFSAILFHRRAGFKANGMAVWSVEQDKVEEIGRFLASFKAVSHCYERTTNGKWKYNLFSMIHGREKEEVLEFCKYVSREKGLVNYKVLFSKREFKKKRIELFSEEFYQWERFNL